VPYRPRSPEELRGKSECRSPDRTDFRPDF